MTSLIQTTFLRGTEKIIIFVQCGASIDNESLSIVLEQPALRTFHRNEQFQLNSNTSGYSCTIFVPRKKQSQNEILLGKQDSLK